MNNKLFFGSALVVLCGLAVGPVCQTSQAAETVAASAPARPALDLARSSAGTQLQVREPGAREESRAAQVLIGDDASASYTLGAGSTSLILTLNKIELLNRLSFTNQGAGGKVTVSVSDTKLPFDSAAWHAAGAAETFRGNGVVDCDLGSVEARYVKVDFATVESGRLAMLSLVGLPAFGGAQTATNAYVSAPEKVADRPSLSVSLNFVNLGSAAKVVGISKASSLGNVQNLKNGNPEAAYTFDPTDTTPTLVVDLGSRQSPEHVVCAYKAPAGRLDLYLVDNPAARDDQSVSLNYVTEPSVQPVSNDMARSKPAYSITTAGEPNINRLSADLGGKSGRYLIAEFHPLTGAHRQAGGRDGKDFKDYKDLKDAPVAGINDAPVAGIANFGDAPGSQAVPLLPPIGANAISP